MFGVRSLILNFLRGLVFEPAEFPSRRMADSRVTNSSERQAICVTVPRHGLPGLSIALRIVSSFRMPARRAVV